MYRHTCFGCEHDKPGQRSHMGFGGCLSKYSDDDDDSQTLLEVRMTLQ